MTDAGNKSDLLIKHCPVIKTTSIMFHFCHVWILRINVYMNNKLFILKRIGVDKTIYNVFVI